MMFHAKFRAALIVGAGMFILGEDAHAFQPTTKVAIANQAQSELQPAITISECSGRVLIVVW